MGRIFPNMGTPDHDQRRGIRDVARLQAIEETTQSQRGCQGVPLRQRQPLFEKHTSQKYSIHGWTKSRLVRLGRVRSSEEHRGLQGFRGLDAKHEPQRVVHLND